MLLIENLYKEFKSDGTYVRAVNQISFEVEEGKFFTLLGPSGCGKTTTLRCIAGLEKPEAGRIFIDGQLVSSGDYFMPPDKRNIGMVFQSYAIWPHMNVFDNVAFPLKVGKEKYSKNEIEERVREALRIVQLEGLEHRSATQLSGGQQQRLALARALVRKPKLLLLDEPLSNLDAALREHMRVELRQLQQHIGITTVYVTHDQLEALALSDMIAVMREGRIEQLGSPQEIYQRPHSKFIAGFIGSTNWIEGRVINVSENVAFIDTPLGKLVASMFSPYKAGDEVILSIRPEAIRVSVDVPNGESYVEGQVVSVMFLGEFCDCYISCRGKELRAKVHPQIKLKRGEKVYLSFLADYCVALSR